MILHPDNTWGSYPARTNDERLAIWAGAFYSCGNHHRGGYTNETYGDKTYAAEACAMAHAIEREKVNG